MGAIYIPDLRQEYHENYSMRNKGDFFNYEGCYNCAVGDPPYVEPEEGKLPPEDYFKDVDDYVSASGGQDQVQAYYERLMSIKDQIAVTKDEIDRFQYNYDQQPSWNIVTRWHWQNQLDAAKNKLIVLEEQYKRAEAEYGYVIQSLGQVSQVSSSVNAGYGATGLIIPLAIAGLVFVIFNKILK